MTDRWESEARGVVDDLDLDGPTRVYALDKVAAALRAAVRDELLNQAFAMRCAANAAESDRPEEARGIRAWSELLGERAERLAPAQPATPRDGGAGERCGTCGGTRRTKFLIRHEGRGPTSEERDCPACTKPAAPPAPVTLMGMDLVCDPSVPPGEVRLASAPAPVTYRAGTVPPVVWCETCREPRPNPHCPACEERPLARDWTEPGGDGGDDDEA
jgi:hypothetical protein